MKVSVVISCNVVVQKLRQLSKVQKKTRVYKIFTSQTQEIFFDGARKYKVIYFIIKKKSGKITERKLWAPRASSSHAWITEAWRGLKWRFNRKWKFCEQKKSDMKGWLFPPEVWAHSTWYFKKIVFQSKANIEFKYGLFNKYDQKTTKPFKVNKFNINFYLKCIAHAQDFGSTDYSQLSNVSKQVD